MIYIRIVLLLLLVSAVTTSAWAAKKERLSSSPPSESNAATETKAVSQDQTATRKGTTASGRQAIENNIPAATTVLEPVFEQPLASPSGTADATAYVILWQSVNGGGGPMASANYNVNSSAGQASIGYSSSASYQASVGYWYGVSATTGCSCPFQCDYDEDGFLTSLDPGELIDVLFAGATEITDPDCPTSRGDFDCDGFPTSPDLGNLIDHLFAGGPPPCDPCSP